MGAPRFFFALNLRKFVSNNPCQMSQSNIYFHPQTLLRMIMTSLCNELSADRVYVLALKFMTLKDFCSILVRAKKSNWIPCYLPLIHENIYKKAPMKAKMTNVIFFSMRACIKKITKFETFRTSFSKFKV